jgi:hypothetical protein
VEDTARAKASARASGDMKSFMSSFKINRCLYWVGR